MPTRVRDTFRGVRIGYGRVSTRDQHPEAQSDALTAAGCERILLDKASGKLARRPELDEALRGLRAGDQLVVTKLDRLGRSLEHLIELSKQLQTRGVDLVVAGAGVPEARRDIRPAVPARRVRRRRVPPRAGRPGGPVVAPARAHQRGRGDPVRTGAGRARPSRRARPRTAQPAVTGRAGTAGRVPGADG